MRFQQLAAFRQRQFGEITVLADEKIEDEVLDTGCFAAEVLEEIEIWAASLIQCHNLTISNVGIREIALQMTNAETTFDTV